MIRIRYKKLVPVRVKRELMNAMKMSARNKVTVKVTIPIINEKDEDDIIEISVFPKDTWSRIKEYINSQYGWPATWD